MQTISPIIFRPAFLLFICFIKMKFDKILFLSKNLYSYHSSIYHYIYIRILLQQGTVVCIHSIVFSMNTGTYIFFPINSIKVCISTQTCMFMDPHVLAHSFKQVQAHPGVHLQSQTLVSINCAVHEQPT